MSPARRHDDEPVPVTVLELRHPLPPGLVGRRGDLGRTGLAQSRSSRVNVIRVHAQGVIGLAGPAPADADAERWQGEEQKIRLTLRREPVLDLEAEGLRIERSRGRQILDGRIGNGS
jgi:hypothetical protein